MTIRLNGEPVDIAPGTTLADLLRVRGLPERGVALALDRGVVPRAEWGARVLTAGAEVEVVRAVGGG